MSEALRSFFLSLALVYVMMGVAAWLTLAKGAGHDDPPARRRIGRLALVAVLVQSAHFAEEWAAGLDERLPAVLGLVPWPMDVFVTFNLSWIAIWLAAVLGIRRVSTWATFALWFLAIACVANGVLHPVLAMVTGGYFPGLWTSPLAAVVGVPLLMMLGRLTTPTGLPAVLARTKAAPEP